MPVTWNTLMTDHDTLYRNLDRDGWTTRKRLTHLSYVRINQTWSLFDDETGSC